MLDERLRRRLEALNREPLPAPPVTAPRAHTATTVRPARRSVPSRQSPLRPGAVQEIPGLVRRGVVVGNELGEHLQIRLSLDELWPGGEALITKRHAHLATIERPPNLSADKAELAALVDAFPRDVLFLDLETCGFAGSSLFLVGVLREVEGQPTVELLLARNYAEERAVLASLWQLVRPASVLVTFNGKSFDWPMVADRSARHLLFRGQQQPQPLHVDILHHARRKWRRLLPDCKLQTLERHICGRGRKEDIPGSQIPAAYQQYVRTGNDHEMDSVLLHNAIDLVTLLDLSMRLAG